MLGAFFWGYASTQIIGGKLCSMYGGAIVLTTAVLAWSICTLLTPIAAAHSMPALLLCRVLMGAGEGMSQPAIHSLVAVWVPKAERTQAIAVASSGMISGTSALHGDRSMGGGLASFVCCRMLIYADIC